jgi:hypothetical protein
MGYNRVKESWYTLAADHLCGLVVYFLATDPEVSGSVPDATRLYEKLWVWNRVHSALSW